MRRKYRAVLFAASAASVLGPVAASAGDDAVTQDQVYQVITSRRLSDLPVDYSLSRNDIPRVVAPASLSPRSLTDAIWIGLGNNESWLNSSNWSTNLVPNADG